jgi:hypothetical protein
MRQVRWCDSPEMEVFMAGFSLCVAIYGVENFYGGVPGSIVKVVQHAEEAGFDQCVITDHVVMGERLDRYPYGRFLTPPDYPWWEPMTALAVIARATARIQLSQGVVPVVFVRTPAQMDDFMERLSRVKNEFGT